MGSHARPRHIARHAAPSPAARATSAAARAAPAVALASAVVVAPGHAGGIAARAAAVAEATTDAYTRPATPAGAETRYWYRVRPGDTLTAIAEHAYGSRHPGRWVWIYNDNRSRIADPNDIYVGQSLRIPDRNPGGGPAPITTTAAFYGTLSCYGLEELWDDAGGAHWAAFMAAEIAKAESGGYQYALSPTDDLGYWQIHGTWGPELSTFNAYGNARAAIYISRDGTDWWPWTTYQTGAYRGRC
jgi:Lysozyme like domain/LysM domain